MEQFLQGNVGKCCQQHCEHQLETGYAENRDQQGDGCHDQRRKEKSLASPSIAHMNIKHRQRRNQHTGYREIMDSREMEF